mmetsp:Transcript_13721/g.54275  ORF Transcript_13721/g.54275 Transcript_13721/m.54275 type:complete len:201 (-) Transcript_13721:1992-2594(-)
MGRSRVCVPLRRDRRARDRVEAGEEVGGVRGRVGGVAGGVPAGHRRRRYRREGVRVDLRVVRAGEGASAGRVGDEGAFRSELRGRERRARGVRVDPRGRGDLGPRGGYEARDVTGPRGGGVARVPSRRRPRRDPHRAHLVEGLHPPAVALRRGGPRPPAGRAARRGWRAIDIARTNVAGSRRRDSLVGRLGSPVAGSRVR